MEKIEITPWFYYDVFRTRKRFIHAPSPALKKVQRIILKKYFKNNLNQKSVREAAFPHCGHKWIMKLDILDFFNSVKEEQIKKVISEYAEDEDTEQIFSLCTLKGQLPTGAPTSPYIANLVLKSFDDEIKTVCNHYGVYYSRYMDDLFFSADREQYILSFIELEVLRLFREYGFEINKDKIKYISSNKHQQILGLNVNNKKPVLTKDAKRKYRAYFHNLIYPLRYSNQKKYTAQERELLGHLAYIKSVDEEYYSKICLYLSKLLKKWNLMNNPCLKNLIRINHL